MLSEADKLRFYDALAEITLLSHSGDLPSVQVSDDAQYLDRASLEAMLYQLNKYGAVGGKGQPPFTIQIYRRGEVAAEIEQGIFFPLVEAGLAVLLDVEPLQPAEVEALLASLEVEGVQSLSPALIRYTGGNPFFVLETLKSLWESGGIRGGRLERLPLAGKVKALITRCLERLSPPALNLARLAAVAGTDLGPELAAAVMQASLLALTGPWAELEGAQILHGSGFAHDLLFEAVHEMLPAPIRAYLHRQVAQFLETCQAHPARMASHWLESEPSRAIPYLLQAARQAEATYQFSEAAGFYQQALEVAEAGGEREQAFALLEALSQVMIRFDTGQRHAALVERMLALADTPEKQGRAWLREAIRLGEHAFGAEAEAAARKGLEYIQQAEAPELRVRLLDALAQSLFVQRKTPDLIAALEQLRDMHRVQGDELQVAISTSRLGIAFDQLERHRQALAFYQEAEPTLRHSADRLVQVGFHHNRAVCLAALGYAEAALEAQLEAQRLLEGMQGVLGRRVHHLNNLALRYYDLERYAEAQQVLEEALALVPEEWGWTRAFSQYQMARLYWVWGAWGPATDWLGKALGTPDLPRRDEATYRILEALLAHRQGQAVAPLLERLEALFAERQGLAYGRYLLARARLTPPEQSLPCLQEALALAQQNDWPSLGIAAQTLWARVLLEQPGLTPGHLEEALYRSKAAMAGLETCWPTGCTRLEVRWVHHQAQAALGRVGQASLQEVLHALEEIALHHVPPQLRSSFLEHNPLSRAVLEAARAGGLVIRQSWSEG
ncbi:hypothetical protein [Meiothermus rufus]|uniref:hypothetical protein n=1 Tax=Meiothermus rufus TaxID=604332 RepID=UPI0003FCC409|nr:hypothetical protein [Meiothermus rufus]